MYDLSSWWESLPPSSQALVGTFIPTFGVIAISNIRHRIKRSQMGAAALPKKSQAGNVFWGVVIVGALYYLRSRVPLIDVILSLPGRFFPSFDAHVGAIYFGFLAGIFAASLASSLYAALFITEPAPALAVQPVASAAVVSVTRRTRTIQVEEE